MSGSLPSLKLASVSCRTVLSSSHPGFRDVPLEAGGSNEVVLVGSILGATSNSRSRVRPGVINKVRLAMERFSRAEGRQISVRPVLQSRAALRGHYSLAVCLVGEQVGTDP